MGIEGYLTPEEIAEADRLCTTPNAERILEDAVRLMQGEYVPRPEDMWDIDCPWG